MHRNKLLTTMRLLLALIALCLGVGVASAQMPTGGKSAQTGPRRSPQNVMQMNKTTQAQRQAAAARNTARKAAAGKKNQVGRNAQQGVRQ